ncbi:MAG: TIGR02453 family protein [Gammaproteobacteria bacterium]|nr:TIGR02453 family protein [Gammaproteobacteria bacterium]MDH5302516.1 TIGR02453 family protein [Gammaproteobacteria bacterium]MDH5322300.1 TIGR02453 family protein [Gammaproteobacteria bacterium]
MAASRFPGFEPATLAFLRELDSNNNRPWFQANKSRYEEFVLDVALRFILAMQQSMADIAPHFVVQATRVGGSLMRIYRDTRFSNAKTPYKTNIGIQFRHEQAKDVHSPGYYVHVDPQQVFLGVGMWRPEAQPLRAIRDRIAERPADWQRVVGESNFKRHFDLGGEMLTRPPRGFNNEHACIADIKRKSFIAVKDLAVDDCLNKQFQGKVETAFRVGSPYMQFLCKAVGVPF